MANMWKNSTKKSNQNEETNLEQNQQMKQTPLGGFLVVHTTIKIWIKLSTKTSCDMSNTKGYLLNNWFWRCYTNNTYLSYFPWQVDLTNLIFQIEPNEKNGETGDSVEPVPFDKQGGPRWIQHGARDEISSCVSSCSYFQLNSFGRRNSETVSRTGSVW